MLMNQCPVVVATTPDREGEAAGWLVLCFSILHPGLLSVYYAGPQKTLLMLHFQLVFFR